MEYIKAISLLGVTARQLPMLTGEGTPTGETIGAVGELYIDTLTGDIYKCVSVAENVYKWESVLGDIDAAMDAIIKLQNSLQGGDSV